MEIKKQKTVSELRDLLMADTGSARSVINALFDDGTFVELGAYVRRMATEYDTDLAAEFEGVITGYGAIEGRLVFAFIQDFTRMKGALSEAHAKKICSLYDSAIKNKAPIIGVFDSAGAFVLEGTAALNGYGKIMSKCAEASGVIPQIALINGICAGSMAAIASMFDFTVGSAEKGKMFVNAPFLIKEKFKDKEAGSLNNAASLGIIDTVAENTASAVAEVKKLITHLPSCSKSGTVFETTPDDANRLTPEIESIISSAGYDMKQVITSISDIGLFIETQASFAAEMLTGFVQFNGAAVAVCANQPSVNGGKLSAKAALKAAKLIGFCNKFRIPLLTLVDTEGFDITLESENSPYSSALASLAMAYAGAGSSKVTVVLGKAYGSPFTILGSKAVGADVAFAVEKAEISIMPPETAVKFAWNNKNDDKAALAQEWKDTMASPLTAARDGSIDDIIAYDELRQRISAAFEMLLYSAEV